MRAWYGTKSTHLGHELAHSFLFKEDMKINCKTCDKLFKKRVCRKSNLFCSKKCYAQHYTQPIEERFWSHVIINDNGCWEWAASFRGQYGKIKIKGKHYSSHRISFYLENGYLPEHMLVCHKCDNPKCVRPDHLFLGTHKDNSQDMVSKGRRRNQYDTL